MLRNAASSLGAEVLSPLSSAGCTPSGAVHPILCYSHTAAPLPPHPSLPQARREPAEMETHLEWQRMNLWHHPFCTKGLLHLGFLEKLTQKKPPVSVRCRIREYGVGEVSAGKNYIWKLLPWMWSEKKILSSCKEKPHISEKTFKVIFCLCSLPNTFTSGNIFYYFDKILDTSTGILSKLRSKFSRHLI